VALDQKIFVIHKLYLYFIASQQSTDMCIAHSK